MARTISEIYDSLNQVKSNMTELADLVTESTGSPVDNSQNLILDASSGSKVAKWRLWLWIVAVASWAIENISDNRVSMISAIVNGQRPHTLLWYEAQTANWQFGYDLEWIDDDHWGYSSADNSAKIVAAVSAQENDMGDIVIKVAKLDGSNLVPLEEIEVEGLVQYWAKWKDAGVKVIIVTASADEILLEATVVRNRLVLSEDGTLLRDSSVNSLSIALQEYMDSVPFNQVIRITDIEAAAKSAEGINDFVATLVQIKASGETEWTTVDREVIPSSGFAQINYDESTFTYIDE
jgi:hypothetical protein